MRMNAIKPVHPYFFDPHGFCQVIHHVYVFSFWRTTGSDYGTFDACQQQVLFYPAIRVAQPANGKLSLLQLFA
jgi:hypothetical protein